MLFGLGNYNIAQARSRQGGTREVDEALEDIREKHIVAERSDTEPEH